MNITMDEVQHYLDVVLPNIRTELANDNLSSSDKLEVYGLYENVLRIVAPYDFSSFNDYLELDEDKREANRGFHHHRKEHMFEVYDTLNRMEIYDEYDVVLISLPPRVGKEQPLYSKVLTPDGWETMGDMVVGKKVIGEDGNTHTVTGVFPQGKKDVYEVVFDDGTKVHCGLEHLWEVQTRDDRKNGKSRVVTTEQMMRNLHVENGKRKNYSIQYVEAVEFSNELDENDVHPYVLGALIGDGSLNGGVKFTNIDQCVLDRVNNLLPDGDSMKQIGDTITYNIKNSTQNRNEKGYPIPCMTLSKIREYGLDVTSKDKFIPHKYLYSTVENRLELLKGLMDTDGYCSGGYSEFTTTSEQLALDVVELIRSLGGRVTVNEKVGSYKKDDVKRECSKVYRLTFNMELNPFYCSRKREVFKPRKVRKHKYIAQISLVGKEECQCIMVDNPRHLYVTDGYNVTHNTTYGIRFLSWVMGKYPEYTQLGTSYSDSITSSFYSGIMEIVNGERYREVFSDAPLMNQNAKRQEIWLKVLRRYPTIAFVPIGGSVTGRVEANNYLYVDDIVSGMEEALSFQRLEKLWAIFTGNFYQRMKQGCKMVVIATRWSVHDPMSRIERMYEGNPRFKSIKMPATDDNGKSNFEFAGGFDDKYYEDIQRALDPLTYNAVFMQNPIEREGLLYHSDEMMYYTDLPEGRPDSIIAICDSKNLGKDYVASAVGYVYDDLVYIDDVVYNDGLPEVTQPAVANLWLKHNVVLADVELNNGGNYYADKVQELVREGGGRTSVRTFFSSNNKDVKIITYSDFVKTNFVFRSPSTYHARSEYAKFMEGIFSWTQTGKNPHDDAPDAIAMMAQKFQEMAGNKLRILDRRKLGL